MPIPVANSRDSMLPLAGGVGVVLAACVLVGGASASAAAAAGSSVSIGAADRDLRLSFFNPLGGMVSDNVVSNRLPEVAMLPRQTYVAAALLLIGPFRHRPGSIGAGGPGPAAPPHIADVPLTQYVDPMIGTASGGTFPGAARPFGMVQMGPDTTDHRYFWHDDTIADFSTTHMSGAGCNNKGDVQFMPVVGGIGASPGTNWSNYHAPMSHPSESVAAGYYAVTLPNNNTRVELTATTRTGLARFTYPSTSQATLLLSASRNNSFTDRGGQLSIVGNNRVTGRLNAGGTCSNSQIYDVFYVIDFDRPFTSFGTYLGGSVSSGSRNTNGNQSGGFVTFNTTGNQVVQMRVALSYVSLAGAEAAIAAENPGFDFNGVRAGADAAWNSMLNSIVVDGGTLDDRKMFYTGLYHTFFTPNVTSDVNGDYIGFDNARHNAGSRVIYQNYSGWDVYRSWIQLVSALAPQASDIVNSMVLDGQQGKAMPMWSDANKELLVMVGDPATIMVSDAHAFGVRGFDTASALQLMVQSATDPARSVRFGHDDWNNLHYMSENAATTIEYAAADFALAQYAAALGDNARFQQFSPRGQYWKNSFNPATSHMQGRRSDGSFKTPWTPTTTDGYVEGNGSVYTWAIPWNAQGLFNMVGGTNAAISRLDAFFSTVAGGTDHPNIDPGNEPSFSAAVDLQPRPAAVEDAGRRQPDRERAVPRRARRLPGRRRPRLDVVLAGVGAAGDVSGDPRHRRARAGHAALPVGDAAAAQRADRADQRAGGERVLALHAVVDGQRGVHPADLAAFLRHRGRLDTELPDRRQPEHEPGVRSLATSRPRSTSAPHRLRRTAASAGTAAATAATGTGARNLALNRPATGSASCNANEGPAKAVNGSVSGGNSDKWCSPPPGRSSSRSTWALRSHPLVHGAARRGGRRGRWLQHPRLRHPGLHQRHDVHHRRAGARQHRQRHQPLGQHQRPVHPAQRDQRRADRQHRAHLRVRGVRGRHVTATASASASASASPPPGPVPGNLALNRPATGSTPCASSEGPEKAVNGSVSGGNSDKWCSGAGASGFLQVDLGVTRSLTSFTVRHAGAGGEGLNGNTRDFDIQVSANGTTFTTVAQVRGNSANVSTHPVTASGRYIRLQIITAEQNGGGTARIYEFEAYG